MTKNNVTPELNNWDDIERLLSSALPAKINAAMGKALQNVTLGIVNSRLAICGMRTPIDTTISQLKELNSNIKNASVSSEKLATALNNITFWVPSSQESAF